MNSCQGKAVAESLKVEEARLKSGYRKSHEVSFVTCLIDAALNMLSDNPVYMQPTNRCHSSLLLAGVGLRRKQTRRK